jgi:hypothetical protein
MSERRLLVSSSDERYFPLAKGLFLSVLEHRERLNFDLGFVDIGCSEHALNWLRRQGVIVVDGAILAADFPRERYGYHLAQICRPYLPDLFEAWEVISWVDCDAWFQDASFIDILFQEAIAHPADVLASTELHYTYVGGDGRPVTNQTALQRYYSAIYEPELAARLTGLPAINSGFIASHRSNPFWSAWKRQIEDIYLRRYGELGAVSRHFGEQFSLNALLRSDHAVRLFDPLYNYLCCWKTPFRDEDGTVRAALPPYPAIGMVHLAGGWRHFGDTYNERGLLYDRGTYLQADERRVLQKVAQSARFR